MLDLGQNMIMGMCERKSLGLRTGMCFPKRLQAI